MALGRQELGLVSGPGRVHLEPAGRVQSRQSFLVVRRTFALYVAAQGETESKC